MKIEELRQNYNVQIALANYLKCTFCSKIQGNIGSCVRWAQVAMALNIGKREIIETCAASIESATVAGERVFGSAARHAFQTVGRISTHRQHVFVKATSEREAGDCTCEG